jgi:hypothetical protein
VSVHKRVFFMDDQPRAAVPAGSSGGNLPPWLQGSAVATFTCTAGRVQAAAFGVPSASGGQVVATANRAQRARL